MLPFRDGASTGQGVYQENFKLVNSRTGESRDAGLEIRSVLMLKCGANPLNRLCGTPGYPL